MYEARYLWSHRVLAWPGIGKGGGGHRHNWPAGGEARGRTSTPATRSHVSKAKRQALSERRLTADIELEKWLSSFSPIFCADVPMGTFKKINSLAKQQMQGSGRNG